MKKTCLIERGKKIGIGKKPDTALDVKGTVTATSFNGMGVAVKGMIIMWYGDANQLPPGWLLCNGQPGTPNLTNRFILAWDSARNNIPKEHRSGGKLHILLEEKHLPPHTVKGTTEDDGNHTHSLEYYDSEKYDKNKVGETMRGSYLGIKNQDWQPTKNYSQVNQEIKLGKHKHTVKAEYTPKDKQEQIEITPPYFGLYFIMYIGVNGKST